MLNLNDPVGLSNKEKLIPVVNVESDDKNYRTMNGATQAEFHSSNEDGSIKKLTTEKNLQKKKVSLA
jgi:hypothetical protein